MDRDDDLHIRLQLLRTLEGLAADYDRRSDAERAEGALRFAQSVRNSIRDEFLAGAGAGLALCLGWAVLRVFGVLP